MQGLEKLHSHSPVMECLDWVRRSGNDALYDARYRAIAEANAVPDGPFLSVIIRTQGKRLDMLQDVLLCLQAQTDPDFEVVMIAHRAEDAAVAGLERLIAAQSDHLSRRIRLLRLQEGERGAPLNLGFASARGAYAVCLDDDDLVFDNWVADFHAALPEHEGMILHAGAYTQPWQSLPAEPDGRQGITADGTTRSLYCQPFRTLRQQSLNYCPFMGLAFPLFLFRDLHVLFDEELTTTEDWDYLLRTAGIAGVYDLPEATAIYRLWNTRDASRTLYRRDEWMRNYRRIIRRIASDPLILPSHEARRFRLEEAGMQGDEDQGRSAFLRKGSCYWTKADGEDFGERQSLEVPVRYEAIPYDGEEEDPHLARIELAFDFSARQADAEGMRWLRIDPAREGFFVLEDVSLTLTYASGQTFTLTDRQVAVTNALREGGRFLFLTDDPMLSFRAPSAQPLTRALFQATLHYHGLPSMSAWVRDIFADHRWADGHRDVAHLYQNDGKGYSERTGLTLERVFHGERYEADFRLPVPVTGLQSLRFDPTMVELLALEDFRVELYDAAGAAQVLPPERYGWTNGFLTPEGIAFPGRIPFLELPVSPEQEIARVRFTGRARFLSPEEMEETLARAVRVPDYAAVFQELEAQKRKKIWERYLPVEEEEGR